MPRTIKLMELSLHNFKGVKDFKFQPDGEDIDIKGQNATGKTTVFDAFTWLLFGKNSSDVKKFNPKPLNSAGEEDLGLEPLVEGTFVVNGKETRLRRELKENWVKPHGQSEKQRASDTTVLYVDDVPKKVGEYQTYINSIVDETTFKMITNPFAFNDLHWKKRRQVLMELVGDITDESIMADMGEQGAKLKELLENHSVSDSKKMIASQRKQINDRVKGIPERIDEANRAIPDVSTLVSKKELESKREELQEFLTKAKDSVTLLRNSKSSVSAYEEKTKLQNKLAKARDDYSIEMRNQSQDLLTKHNDLYGKHTEIKMQILRKNDRIEKLLHDGKKIAGKKTLLQNEYNEVSGRTFDENSLTCPTCGQEYQPEKVAEIKGHFEVEKSNQLEMLETEISDYEVQRQKLLIEYHEVENALKELQLNEKELADKVSEAKDLLDNKRGQIKPFEETEKYLSIMNEIAEVDNKLQNESANNENAIEHAQRSVDKFQRELNDVNNDLMKYKIVESQNKRIEELKDEESDLKEQLNKLDYSDYLLEEFTRTKVSNLEKEINSKFKFVSFKLFETQKNGELNEICEAMVNGVPFSTDLNNAARINAGLDIINTLSSSYGVEAPIFVDNAESVNELIKTQAQKITLSVSQDKELKVA